MFKAILFCTILAYLSGVQGQRTTTTRRPTTTTSTTTPTPTCFPERWYQENGESFFYKVSNEQWNEQFENGDIEEFVFDMAGIDKDGNYFLIIQRSADGLYVYIVGNELYVSYDRNGEFVYFTSGFWEDRPGNPTTTTRRPATTTRRPTTTTRRPTTTTRRPTTTTRHPATTTRRTTTTTRRPTTPRLTTLGSRELQTWINNDGKFFKRISSTEWHEFDRNGVFASRFDVLASDHDKNGRLVLLLRKDDRNFVFLTEGRAFYGSIWEGEFFQFATGFWADEHKRPIFRRAGERSGRNSNPQAIYVTVNDAGKISYSKVGSGPDDGQSDERLEAWTNSEDKSNLFLKYKPLLYVEFVEGIPVNTFTVVNRGEMLNLKNNDPGAGNHSFVSLDSKNAYRGLTQTELKQYATGSFSYLTIPTARAY